VKAGLVVVAAGGVATYLFGERGIVQLAEGGSTESFHKEGAKGGGEEALGFRIGLERLEVKHYVHSEMWSSVTSTVTLTDAQGTRTAQVALNRPIRFGGYRIYQLSIGQTESGETWTSTLMVSREWGYVLVYLGCGLVVAGVVAGLCLRRSAKGPAEEES